HTVAVIDDDMVAENERRSAQFTEERLHDHQIDQCRPGSSVAMVALSVLHGDDLAVGDTVHRRSERRVGLRTPRREAPPDLPGLRRAAGVEDVDREGLTVSDDAMARDLRARTVQGHPPTTHRYVDLHGRTVSVPRRADLR